MKFFLRFNFNDKIDFKRDLNSFPKLAKNGYGISFSKSTIQGEKMRFVILLSALFFNLACYQKNTDDDFYTFEEANTKLISVYQSKDVICNTSRRLTAFVPGRSRKKEIDLCVNAVLAVSCQSWASVSTDATPMTCKSIEFRY